MLHADVPQCSDSPSEDRWHDYFSALRNSRACQRYDAHGSSQPSSPTPSPPTTRPSQTRREKQH